MTRTRGGATCGLISAGFVVVSEGHGSLFRCNQAWGEVGGAHHFSRFFLVPKTGSSLRDGPLARIAVSGFPTPFWLLLGNLTGGDAI